MKINNGADVNIQNNSGDTALIMAAYSGHYTNIEVLINNKANLNLKNNNGNTALQIAKDNGHMNCVELLKSKTDQT
jgi:ankyrin repeat protein